MFSVTKLQTNHTATMKTAPTTGERPTALSASMSAYMIAHMPSPVTTSKMDSSASAAESKFEECGMISPRPKPAATSDAAAAAPPPSPTAPPP